MTEQTWSLRITLKGTTKTFAGVDPDATVGALAERAAKEFRVKQGVDLAGGFPPQKMDAASTLRDATADQAALRGLEKAAAKRAPPAKPAARKKKPASKRSREACDENNWDFDGGVDDV